MTVTLEQLETFLRQQPPREVPSNIRQRRTRAHGLLLMTVIGGCFLVFGGVFSAIFFPWKLASEIRLDLGHGQQAVAEVTDRQQTSMSVNERRVHQLHYHFQTASGQPIQGSCYCHAKVPQAGDQVDVDYLPENPHANRLTGGRINPFGYFGSFVILFPLIGLTIMLGAVMHRRREMRILRWGRFTMATVADVQATNVSVNHDVRHRITLHCDDPELPQSVQFHGYADDVRIARERLDAGEPVGVLYDPSKPSRMIFAESLLTH